MVRATASIPAHDMGVLFVKRGDKADHGKAHSTTPKQERQAILDSVQHLNLWDFMPKDAEADASEKSPEALILPAFRASKEFKKLSIEMQHTLLYFERFSKLKDFKPDSEFSKSLAESFGLLYMRMNFPDEQNKWIGSLTKEQLMHPKKFDGAVLFEFYQDACKELKQLEAFFRVAEAGKTKIPREEAMHDCLVALRELSIGIIECGPGSSENISEILKRLSYSLFPPPLSEVFVRAREEQAKQIVLSHIRVWCKDDSGLPITEIHRVLAYLHLVSNAAGLPDFPLTDRYAKGFVKELMASAHIVQTQRQLNILAPVLRNALRADKVFMQMGNDYLAKISNELLAKRIDPTRIKWSDQTLKKIQPKFAVTYGLPHENYLFQDVERADYSRVLAKTSSALAAYIADKIHEDPEALDVYRHNNIQSLVTKKGGTNATFKLAVYVSDDMVWTGTSPHAGSGKAGQVGVDDLSHEWMHATFHRPYPSGLSVMPAFNVLLNAITNSAAKESYSDPSMESGVLRSFLVSPTMQTLGMSWLSQCPLRVLADANALRLILQIKHYLNPDQSTFKHLFNLQDIDRMTSSVPVLYQAILSNVLPDFEPQALVHDFLKKVVSEQNITFPDLDVAHTPLQAAVLSRNVPAVQTVMSVMKKECLARLKDELNNRLFPFDPLPAFNSLAVTLPNVVGPTDAPAEFSFVSYAAMWGQQSLVKALIQDGANINAVDDYGVSALHYSVLSKNHEMTRFLLENGARTDPKKVSDTYVISVNSPLDNAVQIGDLEACKLLLAHDADINTKGHHGYTLLHRAYINRDLPMINFLIEHGITLQADITGKTAYAYLAPTSRYSDVKESKRHLIYLTHHLHFTKKLPNEYLSGKSSLHFAASVGDKDAIDFIAKNNMMDLDSKSAWSTRSNRKTAIMEAAKYGHLDAVKALVEHGADATKLDFKKRSALDLARTKFKNESEEVTRNKLAVASYLEGLGIGASLAPVSTLSVSQSDTSRASHESPTRALRNRWREFMRH